VSTFAERLEQACAGNPNLPPLGHGLQAEIARAVDVSQEAVRKWVAGVAKPRPATMKALADWLGVEESWLALGITLEVDRREIRAHGRKLSGAAMLVRGLITLAGGACGDPKERDSQGRYVDFYTFIDGQTHAVHVALAREVNDGTFEVLVPKEYEDVRVIGVVPVGRGHYDFLELPTDQIGGNKTRKAGAYSISLTRVGGGRYVTGDYGWPRIRDFADFS
jgi:transcriptional regulator with XRE-family HTH domain